MAVEIQTKQGTVIKDPPAFVPPRAGSGNVMKASVAKEPPKEALEGSFDSEGMPDLVSDIPVKQLPETKPGGDKLEKPIGAPKDEKVVEPKDKPTKKDLKDAMSVLKAPAEATKKDEIKVEETSKEESVKATETKQPFKKDELSIEPVIPVQKDGSKRDYAGFSDVEVRHLKNMDRQAYEFTSKLIKDNKELQPLKGSLYYQHPHAYILSPEYQQLQQDSQLADTEARYWQQQLALIGEGKPWKSFEGWDSRTGQPIFGTEQQPTPQNAEQIRLWLNQCVTVGQQIKQRATQYPVQYQQQVQQDNNTIKQIQAQKFPWVADNKMLDYSVIMADGTEQKIKDIQQNFSSLFPVYMRQHPATEVASNLMVSLIIKDAQLREALKNQKIDEIINEEVAGAEPDSKAAPTNKPKGKVIGGVTEFNLDGMPD